MSGTDAVRVVQEKRSELKLHPSHEVMRREKCIVEYKEDRSTAGSTTDRVAWVVTLGGALGGVDVHVEDRTGKVLTVIRKR